jgi:hypothetical protein
MKDAQALKTGKHCCYEKVTNKTKPQVKNIKKRWTYDQCNLERWKFQLLFFMKLQCKSADITIRVMDSKIKLLYCDGIFLKIVNNKITCRPIRGFDGH